MIFAWMSPVTAVPMPPIRVTHMAITIDARKMGTSLRRFRCHALIPITNAPAVTIAAVMVCGKVTSAVLFVSTGQIEVSSARPRASLIRKPTGCCIHEFAARMKYADSQVPTATAQIEARCSRGGSRSQPKIHKPMKVDSRKNASRPSIASGAPKMSPTKREYALQFMPNWNSCTSPVTTPMAKLIRNSLPQNLVIRLYFGSCVR